MASARRNKNTHYGSGLHSGKTQMPAIKSLLASQLQSAMKARKLTKLEMSRRMRTSRVQLDRLLDPANESVTLATLRKAAAVVGCQVRLELI